jgi:hypothetical protein
MSRTYQALQKAVRFTTFDPDASPNGRPDTGRGLAEIPVSPRGDLTQVVADLLQNKLLTHSFGVQREWEVRTTLVANRQAWRYRSSVCVHGKEVRKDFPPIDCVRTLHIQQAEAVTEDMLAAFAREAMAAHFARCASVAEHVLMASIPAQPPPRHPRMTTIVLVLFGVVALVTAYRVWKGSESVTPEQPHANQIEQITDTPHANQIEQITPTPHANQAEQITPTPRLPPHWTW